VDRPAGSGDSGCPACPEACRRKGFDATDRNLCSMDSPAIDASQSRIFYSLSLAFSTPAGDGKTNEGLHPGPFQLSDAGGNRLSRQQRLKSYRHFRSPYCLNNTVQIRYSPNRRMARVFPVNQVISSVIPGVTSTPSHGRFWPTIMRLLMPLCAFTLTLGLITGCAQQPNDT